MKILEPSETPAHLSIIPELDLSQTLFAERLSHPWVRLGAIAIGSTYETRPVAKEYLLNTLLIDPGGFGSAFPALGAVGNVLWTSGQPGVVQSAGDTWYEPFYEFPIAHPTVIAEPLVIPLPDAEPPELFINPDLWLFLKLVERNVGSGKWRDPRRQVDVLVKRREQNLEVVEIRTAYLLRYLQARQKSLLVALYRQSLFFEPPAGAQEIFVKEDFTLGSPTEGVKAILENWGLRHGELGGPDYLQRRVHLWYEIKPPERSADVSETAAFDVLAFTLPTHDGPVAPARWKHRRTKQRQRRRCWVCQRAIGTALTS